MKGLIAFITTLFCLVILFALTGGLAHAQVLPLPGPVTANKDYYGGSPEVRVRQRLSIRDTDWMDVLKPEKDQRTQATLDRLLFKDFLKRLPTAEVCK